ncbi:hypothetical protein [Novosphingobium rosa]|uniref:hypothetical protein n=1 Tax=Novosphingobium rosa TaxID=76978 RepID=UPI00082EC180|nr:hypothetical protein [Novosphingobium rosa]
MTNRLAACAALVLSLSVASPVLAHGFTKPQHGGIVTTSGETLFELVAKPAGVQLYVIDDDEPVAASGMTASLTTNTGGKTQNVPLKPAAGNRFDGPALKLAPGAKVAVMVINKTSQAHLGGTFIIK